MISYSLLKGTKVAYCWFIVMLWELCYVCMQHATEMLSKLFNLPTTYIFFLNQMGTNDTALKKPWKNLRRLWAGRWRNWEHKCFSLIIPVENHDKRKNRILGVMNMTEYVYGATEKIWILWQWHVYKGFLGKVRLHFTFTRKEVFSSTLDNHIRRCKIRTKGSSGKTPELNMQLRVWAMKALSKGRSWSGWWSVFHRKLQQISLGASLQALWISTLVQKV